MPTKLSRYAEAVMELCVLAALILVPVFFHVYSQRVFEPDKLTLLRSLALVMIAAWSIVMIERARQPREDGAPAGETWTRRLLHTPLFVPVLLLVIVYLISTIFSITPWTSLLGSYQRLQGTYTTFAYIVVFVMIASVLRRREQIDRLVTATILASVPVCLYAMLQHSSLDPLPWGGDVVQRVAANMGNAIFVAAYLIMVMPLTLGRIVIASHAILTDERVSPFDVMRLVVYIFILLFQGITIYWSGSRGPWLGMIAGVWVLALFGLLMLRSSAAGRGQVRLVDVGLPIAGVVLANIVAFVVMIVLVLLGTAAGVLRAADATALWHLQAGYVMFLAPFLGMPLTFALAVSRRTWRWAWLAGVLELVFLVSILGLLNINNGPLEFARTGHPFARLGQLFETEGGTGKVRTLIWEGAYKLITPHDPLVFPDGKTDPWNVIRPLVGYGPESMYVAYNRFYPPDLAHYESRNASPDRSHNETFDSLVITGLLGLCAYLFVFGSVFYYGYRWLGWIGSRRSAWLYAGLWIAGALIGAIGAIASGESKYLGVAIPAGVIGLALILYVMLYALFRYGIEWRAFMALSLVVGLAGGALGGFALNHWLLLPIGLAAGLVGGLVLYRLSTWAFDGFEEPERRLSFEQQFLMVALVSAVLGHFVEINMGGIAIAATRTLFWSFAGMMFVIGYVWPRTETAAAPARAAGAPSRTSGTQATAEQRKRKRRTGAARPAEAGGMGRWLGPALAMAVLLTLILMTMGFELLNNTRQPVPDNALDLISRSLTTLMVKPAGAPAPLETGTVYTLLIIILTWVIGAVLLVAELGKAGVFRDAQRSWTSALQLVLGVSFLLTAFYYLLHATALIETSKIGGNATSIDEFVRVYLRISDSLAGLLTLYYAFMFLLLFVAALALLGGMSLPQLGFEPLPAAVGGVLLIAAIVMISATNVNVVQADVVYKEGDAIDKSAGSLDEKARTGQSSAQDEQNRLASWKAAVAVYSHALDLAPNEDYYYLFLGRAYLQYASASTDVVEQDRLLTDANNGLLRAQKINPLNTDHTANLARLYRRWAELVRARKGDATANAQKVNQLLAKSNDYYTVATKTLSPNNAVLWTEWCDLRGRTMQDWDGAKQICTQSIAIDDRYDRTYATLGDVNVLQMNAITGTVPFSQIQDLLAQAAQNYQKAADAQTLTRQYSDSATYYNSACEMWRQAGHAREAVDACSHVISVSLTTVPQLRQDVGLWNTYKNLMLSYAELGDGCRTAGDQACAQKNYQQAFDSGQASLAVATQPKDKVFVGQRVVSLTLQYLPAVQPQLAGTYESLMAAYEALGDQCTQAKDAACARDNYQHALASAQSALSLASADQKTGIQQHIDQLQQKISTAGAAPAAAP